MVEPCFQGSGNFNFQDSIRLLQVEHAASKDGTLSQSSLGEGAIVGSEGRLS